MPSYFDFDWTVGKALLNSTYNGRYPKPTWVCCFEHMLARPHRIVNFAQGIRLYGDNNMETPEPIDKVTLDCGKDRRHYSAFKG